jgi:hypothetical protein
MREEIIEEEVNHSDSIYIGKCRTCKDDVYSRGPQKYIIHYYGRNPNIYCSEFCFDKARDRRRK